MTSLKQLLSSRGHVAPATSILIAINVVVFLAMLWSGAGLWHTSNGVQLIWGANFGPATEDGEWWRLGSAMFLHFGVLHLVMNMWALWDGGQLVEQIFGTRRFLFLYLVSGLTGNLFSLVLHSGPVVSGGASGAIFGIYGALLSYLWLQRKFSTQANYRWLFWGVLAFSLLTISFGFFVSGIDNAAHSGGVISGLLCGLFLMPETGEPWGHEGVLRKIAAAGLVMLVGLLVVFRPEPAYFLRDELRLRQEIGQFLRNDAEISSEWERILREGSQGGVSFDELAQQIDHQVFHRYSENFDELSAQPKNTALPSAFAFDQLVRYAERRRDASRALVEGLREKDPVRIQQALDQAKVSRQK